MDLYCKQIWRDAGGIFLFSHHDGRQKKIKKYLSSLPSYPEAILFASGWALSPFSNGLFVPAAASGMEVT